MQDIDKILTPLKARKAKFGFKLDYLNVTKFIPLGHLLEALENRKYQYSAEMQGMHGTDFRLYTDDEVVARFIHNNFCVESIQNGSQV